LLAGLMTAFGAPTRPIPIDGVGEFDGVMLGAFRRPRIEGRMIADEMRAFDVTWGEIEGQVVIENAYAIVSNAVVRRDSSRMSVDGQFSLGYPRRDGGEEINARISIERRPITDLLGAFDLGDYPVEGLLSGDFRLYGPYTRPFGYGRLQIVPGMAYGEPFASGTAALRFEGNGVRIDAIEVEKGGGRITGAAFIGWNGAYTFDAAGQHLAVETLSAAAPEGIPPLTGLFDFNASGSATFAEPRYEVKVAVHDLFLGDEGIGQVTGRFGVRDRVLTYALEAASTRLAVSGTGRIALTAARDAELSFRVTDTSLDPYIRAFQPTLSPFTTAVASGTIRVVGELSNRDALRVDGSVEQLDLRLFDYQLRNQGPIAVAVDRQTLEIVSLRLVGDDTALDLIGSVDLARQALSLQANGAANLAVLQGFVRDLRSSGRADVTALIGGTVAAPQISGQALLTQGRLRHFSFPNALEAIDGIVAFNAAGIRLDGVSARLGGGPVRFGGRVGVAGYRIVDLDVTVTGDDMRIRFPEGVHSVIDATLALQGPSDGAVLSGTVLVDGATWTGGLGGTGNVFSLGSGDQEAPERVAAGESGVRLRYDIRIVAPSTLRIDNEQARIVASAELTLRGTFDRPLLFGRADIERGDVRFEGRRYLVTRGSIDFTNPNRIQPFFDVEAETRVRVPNQTYQVTLRMTGTTERLQPEFSSDPPLRPVDILALLFSDSVPGEDIELASLQQPNEREQRLLESRATRALTGALSNEVGKVVEQTFGVDTFQITPLLVDPSQQSSRLNVNPAARVTIGKRISERVYLTYARSLSSSTTDEIILLEYDQSDSLAWLLSQNEDRTYALEVRKRHTF
jgi:translocation and assembly module TamB